MNLKTAAEPPSHMEEPGNEPARRASALSCLVTALPLLLLLTACGPKQADLAAAAQLEQELQQLRASNQELQRLRADNQELPRLRRDNEELRRLREQTKDLARLREENDQLRGQLQALKAPKPKP